MKRSPDNKWTEKQYALYRGGPLTATWAKENEIPVLDPPLDIEMRHDLVWNFPDMQPFPSWEDLCEGVYWFERSFGRRPDRIVIHSVNGSHLLGIEVAVQ